MVYFIDNLCDFAAVKRRLEIIEILIPAKSKKLSNKHILELIKTNNLDDVFADISKNILLEIKKHSTSDNIKLLFNFLYVNRVKKDLLEKEISGIINEAFDKKNICLDVYLNAINTMNIDNIKI